MSKRSCCRALRSLCVCGALLLGIAAAVLADDAPPERDPATFTPQVDTFDYIQREVMIPMRDGVKLYTLILIPRGAQRAPILLTRTPYGADERIAQQATARICRRSSTAPTWPMMPSCNGGYIRVLQDVRGKHGSEGDYVMNRPLQGPSESHRGRSFHRYLRHHRLAGEEHPGIERQGRHPRHLVRRLHLADGAGASASGAARRGADQRHGRRLDGR